MTRLEHRLNADANNSAAKDDHHYRPITPIRGGKKSAVSKTQIKPNKINSSRMLIIETYFDRKPSAGYEQISHNNSFPKTANHQSLKYMKPPGIMMLNSNQIKDCSASCYKPLFHLSSGQKSQHSHHQIVPSIGVQLQLKPGNWSKKAGETINTSNESIYLPPAADQEAIKQLIYDQ